MKLTGLLLFTALMQVTASTYSQVSKLTLDFKERKLEQVFADIEQMTDYSFLYKNELIAHSSLKSGTYTDKEVLDVLDDVLKGENLRYEIRGKLILIVPNEQNQGNSWSAQQPSAVRGRVADASGAPLPGVTVVVKGTTRGTITDADGNYSLPDVSPDATLMFSFVGMKAVEIKTGGKQTIDAVMHDETIGLEEIVAVGYGTMRKSDVTGSISVAKGEELLKSQNFSALENLRGKVSGVNIYSNSSQPGAYANRVVIRGMSTINSSSNPLYVVDGVVMEDFHLLNPNDIESIEVLKDASAAAIYGARGANGVILVTSKRGTKGESGTVTYQGSVSVNSVARYMDLLNAQDWTDAFMIGLENENKYQGKSWSLNRADWFTDRNYFDASGNPLYDTDWQKEATRTTISHNHQVNIQQGGDKSSTGTFLNFTDQQGTVNNTYSKRLNAKLAYDANPLSWLSSSVNLLVNHTWGRYTPETGGGQDARRTMIEMLPWLPIRDADGKYTTSSSSSMADAFGFEGMSNPVMILDLQKRMRYNTQIFGNAAFTFHLADGLDLKTQFGADGHLRTYKGYSSISLNNISMPNGWAYITHTNTLYWQEETFLTYNKIFQDKHRVNAMAGLSWTERTYDYDHSYTEGFDDDFYEWYNMSVGTIPNAPESDWSRWRMNSYFLRFAYTYNDRYSATVTGRVDGSSKFGENNKYAFFPSAGVAWNISNEDFMRDNSVINTLKLHTSYGMTGNSEIDPYKSLAKVTAGTYLIDGSRAPYSYVGSLANPDLKWEKTGQWDIGIDMGMFSNRLNFDVSYYNKKTTDLLLDCPIPTSTGFSSVFKNIGSVRNEGFDIMVSGIPVKSGDFTWNTTLNMNYNKNKVLSLGENDEDILLNSWVGGYESIVRVGENMSSFYGYKRYGVYTVEDYEAGNCRLNQVGRAKRSTEKEILGKGMPDWTGSFINTFTYKNFDLMVDLQFVLGVETMQQFYHSTYDRFGITNGLKEVLSDAYDGTNPNTMQQAIYLCNSGHAGQDTTVDSSWVVDGSYLRLNMLQLGYNFTSKQCKAIGISGLRIYGSGSNLFLLCSDDFTGYDPESTSQADDNKFGQNMTFFSYPRARTFTLGVNVTF